ncbi:hypothetical protein V6N13_058131 [Hibiscus sabdariffa]|uniref:Uncharacterized protein n=1 Tax=Hibiscus sabdariffa TaxID=183260 RepID=A0ABR2GH41_9ROSI
MMEGLPLRLVEVYKEEDMLEGSGARVLEGGDKEMQMSDAMGGYCIPRLGETEFGNFRASPESVYKYTQQPSQITNGH